MGIESAFSNLTDGLDDAVSGHVTKGFFVIPSFKTGAGMVGPGLDEEDALETIKTESELNAMTEKIQKSILKKAQALLEKPDGSYELTGKGKKFSAEEASDLGEDFFTYEVQYNPATITFRTMGSGKRRDKMYGSLGDSQFYDVDVPTYTDFNCTLIFEAINPSDAFSHATDSFSLTGNVANQAINAANTVSGLVGGNDSAVMDYSVRNNVMGFLSLMTRMGWRNITFYYGTTCFHGILTSVRPTYKMFNSKGEPILAEVAITIRQDTSSELDELMYRQSFMKVVDYKAN